MNYKLFLIVCHAAVMVASVLYMIVVWQLDELDWAGSLFLTASLVVMAVNSLDNLFKEVYGPTSDQSRGTT